MTKACKKEPLDKALAEKGQTTKDNAAGRMRRRKGSRDSKQSPADTRHPSLPGPGVLAGQNTVATRAPDAEGAQGAAIRGGLTVADALEVDRGTRSDLGSVGEEAVAPEHQVAALPFPQPGAPLPDPALLDGGAVRSILGEHGHCVMLVIITVAAPPPRWQKHLAPSLLGQHICKGIGISWGLQAHGFCLDLGWGDSRLLIRSWEVPFRVLEYLSLDDIRGVQKVGQALAVDPGPCDKSKRMLLQVAADNLSVQGSEATEH